MADGPDLRSKPTGQSYLPCPTLDWIGIGALSAKSLSYRHFPDIDDLFRADKHYLL